MAATVTATVSIASVCVILTSCYNTDKIYCCHNKKNIYLKKEYVYTFSNIFGILQNENININGTITNNTAGKQCVVFLLDLLRRIDFRISSNQGDLSGLKNITSEMLFG